MSLEALQKEIEKKGRDDAKKLESSARDQSAQVLDLAKKNAREIGAKAREEIAQEVKRLEEEYEANAQLARSTLVTGARDYVVGEALKRVRKGVAEDLRDKQKKIFDQAAKIAKGLGDIDKMRFVVNRKDAALVKGWGGRVEFKDILGGVIVYSEDAKIKIDASIDTMIENNADNIRSIISNALYHQGRQGGAARRKHTQVRKKGAGKNSVPKAKKSATAKKAAALKAPRKATKKAMAAKKALKAKKRR